MENTIKRKKKLKVKMKAMKVVDIKINKKQMHMTQI